MFETLVVAVDSSPQSDKAVAAAIGLARLSGGTLQLVHVVEHVPAAGRAGAFEVEDPAAESQALEKEIAQVKSSGVPYTVKLVKTHVGHVAREIVEAADEAKADVIVMGSRGLSATAAVVLGSTAYKVLHIATCPVLITH